MDFRDYINNRENIHEKINMENPSAVILCGDFNARFPLFLEDDSGNREGDILSNFLISNNMEEPINEPT